jgi:hypothetical protein
MGEGGQIDISAYVGWGGGGGSNVCHGERRVDIHTLSCVNAVGGKRDSSYSLQDRQELLSSLN